MPLRTIEVQGAKQEGYATPPRPFLPSIIYSSFFLPAFSSLLDAPVFLFPNRQIQFDWLYARFTRLYNQLPVYLHSRQYIYCGTMFVSLDTHLCPRC